MMMLPLWILSTLVKGTVLLFVAVLLAAALRHASAALRHLVWGTGLVMLLVLPLVSLLVPWRLPVGSFAALSARPDVSLAQAPVGSSQTTGLATPSSPPVNAAPSAPPPAAPPPQASGPSLSPRTLLAAAFAIWCLGALWLVGRLIVGALLLRRVVRRATPLEDSEWRRPLLEAADRLALPRLPRLVMSDRLPMPFACGILHPAIVLPAGAVEWDDRRRRAVLFHELAHLTRYDLIGNALGQLACAVYWFHPLVWMAARKLRIESERACDDLVLGVGTRPSEYADHLLQIVCRAARSRTPAVALPMAQRDEFEGRMLAILERGARREPASGRHAALLGALALTLLIPLAALAPGRAESASMTASSTRVDSAVERALRPIPHPVEHAILAPRPRAVTPPPDSGRATGAIDSTGVVTALMRALADSVSSVREDAAYALGRLEASAAVPALVTRLPRDPSPKVREMIAWALGQIQNHDATDGLGTVAQHDSSETVRAMAVWALGQIQDASAVPALVAVLRDRSAEVRGRAAWALGTIAPATAPSGLAAALDDPAADVRVRAAWALGQIADSSAVSRLAAALRDSTAEVRKAAMWALGEIGGDAAQGALIQALDDKDPEVRARAARSLAGGHGEPWPWPWPMPIIR